MKPKTLTTQPLLVKANTMLAAVSEVPGLDRRPCPAAPRSQPVVPPVCVASFSGRTPAGGFTIRCGLMAKERRAARGRFRQCRASARVGGAGGSQTEPQEPDQCD